MRNVKPKKIKAKATNWNKVELFNIFYIFKRIKYVNLCMLFLSINLYIFY
jgi:hypothetical protein